MRTKPRTNGLKQEIVVEVTGGSFSSNIAENIVNSDMQATTTSGGETRFVVGKTAVENATQALKSGDKNNIQKICGRCGYYSS
ncbi:MAG: hypothetical protein V8Q17_11110 [Acutalibacteraceae bacterium]